MVMNTLFLSGIPDGCAMRKMEGELPDPEKAANIYEKKLPETIDILLLSFGQDRHIASLFPGNNALQEYSRSVVSIVGPKSSPERLTITPCAIRTAISTFLFARSKEKGRILSKSLEQPYDIETLPVRLVKDSTWILDSDAPSQINHLNLK